MSSAIIYGRDINDHRLVQKGEFKNSWRGVIMFWDAILRKYYPKLKSDSFLSLDLNNRQKVWDFSLDKEKPKDQRRVMVWTFDDAYVKKENFKAFQQDLINAYGFIAEQAHKNPTLESAGAIAHNHFGAFANCISEINLEGKCDLAMLTGTSVNDVIGSYHTWDKVRKPLNVWDYV